MKSIGASSVLLSAMLACSSAHAGLEGQSFIGSYRTPTIDTPYALATVAPSSFVVGAGVEAIANVEGVTFVSIDFSATSLSLLLNTSLAQPAWGAVAFNGLVFDLTSPGALGITGVSVDALTTMPGFDSNRVHVSGNRIAIDWNGLGYVDGTRVVVDFATAVPEPATCALMLAGLGLMGVIQKRLSSHKASDFRECSGTA
jgi:PEP-CTERM motif